MLVLPNSSVMWSMAFGPVLPVDERTAAARPTPQQRSRLLPVLHTVNDRFGWVSEAR
jgi:NADH:ubiquinone oxidoreductase subunit E